MTNKVSIEGFSLQEFLQKAQEAIQQGYVFDFESNDNFPSRFGNVYACVMLPASPVEEAEATTPEASQEKAAVEPSGEPSGEPGATSGRKKKGQQ